MGRAQLDQRLDAIVRAVAIRGAGGGERRRERVAREYAPRSRAHAASLRRWSG